MPPCAHTRAFPKAQLLVPRSEQAFWFENPQRQELFKKAAQAKAVLAGAHLPRLARIEAKGTGYQALPIGQS